MEECFRNMINLATVMEKEKSQQIAQLCSEKYKYLVPDTNIHLVSALDMGTNILTEHDGKQIILGSND